jgi:hypothetical protein
MRLSDPLIANSVPVPDAGVLVKLTVDGSVTVPVKVGLAKLAFKLRFEIVA